MEKKTDQGRGNPGKRHYVKPKVTCISLEDGEALSEFCKEKPFTCKDLRDMGNEMLKENKS